MVPFRLERATLRVPGGMEPAVQTQRLPVPGNGFVEAPIAVELAGQLVNF